MYLLLLADLNYMSNYSCGSIVLTCPYRSLNHEIGFNQDNIWFGSYMLLQYWT